MPERFDLYSNYREFTNPVLDTIRRETFGTDIGQNSWVTIDEYERFLPWLKLGPNDHILEVASGSGGPALFVARATGCRVTGIDANENGAATGSQMAARLGEAERVQFKVADATTRLPFENDSFDGVLCIDAMNHLPNRLEILREWHRILRVGRRALFTDSVVITGPVTNEELALRSSIGTFLFVPPGVNEELITGAGFQLIRQEDVTANAALVSGRWFRAREAHKDELLKLEGQQHFEGLQKFFETVHSLTSEKRLSRILYLIEKY